MKVYKHYRVEFDICGRWELSILPAASKQEAIDTVWVVLAKALDLAEDQIIIDWGKVTVVSDEEMQTLVAERRAEA